MKRTVAKGLAVVVLAQFVGCAAAHLVRPTTYGGELDACEAKSPAGPEGWKTYTPCCVDVAAKYGRDPSFCFPDTTGADDGAAGGADGSTTKGATE